MDRISFQGNWPYSSIKNPVSRNNMKILLDGMGWLQSSERERAKSHRRKASCLVSYMKFRAVIET